MSGYDALDELYERLRDAEETQHAQRAGGITPETIKAARGGVADGHGRECHVVDENAADGEKTALNEILKAGERRKYEWKSADGLQPVGFQARSARRRVERRAKST